jgi:chlorite dismutase
MEPASAHRLLPARNMIPASAQISRAKPSEEPKSQPVRGFVDLPAVPPSYLITFPFERENNWYHQVEVGETVAAIAHRYGTSAEQLRKHNVLAGATALQPGQLLYIPQ